MRALHPKSRVRREMRVEPSKFQPAPWEKICMAAAGFMTLALIGRLLLRSAPLPDNLVPLANALTGLAVAVVGASLPGYLNVDFSAKGLAIRGGGALALFLVTFAILQQAIPTNPPTTSFRILDRETMEPVFRGLRITYRSGGATEYETVDSQDKGMVVLKGHREHIHVQGIQLTDQPKTLNHQKDANGYRYDNTDGNTLWLKRVDDFFESVKPAQPESGLISCQEYDEMVAMERDPKRVKVECVNETNHWIDLILFRVPHPKPERVFSGTDSAKLKWASAISNPLDWTSVRCPPDSEPIQLTLGSRHGGYFVVYGSVFGMRAKYLIQEPLYLYEESQITLRMNDLEPSTLSAQIN